MKKIWVVALVAVVGLALLGASAQAWCGMGYGGGPRGAGYGAGPAVNKPVDVNALRAFQKETLPLRDEAMAKRVEIRNEYLKDKPDQAKIAGLQKEIIDLRLKIRTAAEKQGLPAGFGMGMGGRGHGYGPHMAGGRGYGAGNCPMR